LRLLVSVRSAAEAKVAVESGADIVDAKEPAAGPLGAVGPGVLAEILRALPGEAPLGIALGDVRTERELGLVLDRLAPMARPGADGGAAGGGADGGAGAARDRHRGVPASARACAGGSRNKGTR